MLSLKGQLNILNTQLNLIDEVSEYAYHNQEARLIIETYKDQEKNKLLQDLFLFAPKPSSQQKLKEEETKDSIVTTKNLSSYDSSDENQ